MSTGTRFKQFLANIKLTDAQKLAGGNARESVIGALNAFYYNSSSGTSNSQYVGSWGKRTRVRPPRDVDVLYTLPYSVYERFQTRAGNKQSQILQEVKGVLLKKYTTTAIRGSGPVVLVPFVSYNVEVIPAFKLNNGSFFICMTDGGGYYKTAAYDAEVAAMVASNNSSNYNTRDLVRMMKRWQAYYSVPVKSFWIEILSTGFVASWGHRGQTSVYYDYMVRDFLEYMIARANTNIFAPGTAETMALGNAWETKAKSSLATARLACSYEANSQWDAAGLEWQKLFGTDMPRTT